MFYKDRIDRLESELESLRYVWVPVVDGNGRQGWSFNRKRVVMLGTNIVAPEASQKSDFYGTEEEAEKAFLEYKRKHELKGLYTGSCYLDKAMKRVSAVEALCLLGNKLAWVEGKSGLQYGK